VRTELIFLEIARKDLEAAKSLYDRKLHAHSVFYLQQSIEKAVKSFGMWTKTLTETDAKDAIGHEAWKAYLKVFNEVRNKIARLEKASDVLPKLKETSLMKELEISKLKDMFDKYEKVFLNKNARRSISFSRKDLQNIATEINKLSKELKEKLGQRTAIRISEKETEHLKEKLYEFLNIFSEINPNVMEAKDKLSALITPEFIGKIFKKLIKPVSELIFCYLSLFYLSLVFSSHAVTTRYPQDSFNPLMAYSEKMPLIRMLDSFIRILEETLQKLNYTYVKMLSGP